MLILSKIKTQAPGVSGSPSFGRRLYCRHLLGLAFQQLGRVLFQQLGWGGLLCRRDLQLMQAFPLLHHEVSALLHLLGLAVQSGGARRGARKKVGMDCRQTSEFRPGPGSADWQLALLHFGGATLRTDLEVSRQTCEFRPGPGSPDWQLALLHPT